MSLAGKTLFISGASRGIGLSIALRAARDGANIVIAAKTAEAHPKLPGTIYTAAQEIEKAGGKCLPCVVDIRYEDQVKSAVEKAASHFGGIDILVNNASAIQLTGTLATDMKRFDLMMGINTRGTYLCSQACIPFLQKGKNPHILNLSPPLNMNPRWFKDHVAYTMAKYGMSMCVLGMSQELKPDGIAVNALWPRTAIWTAAMSMLGGKEIGNNCRKPEIVADAAHVILTKPSREYTGHFCIDDDVLREAGVTDFEQYAIVKGAKLMPDFFLDDGVVDAQEFVDQIKSGKSSPKPAASGASEKPKAGGVSVAKLFDDIKKILSPEIVEGVKATYQFKLTGAEPGTWSLDLKNGSGSVASGEGSGKPQCTLTLSSDDFVKLFTGKMKATDAFFGGKLKIAGDMSAGMKLEKLMRKMGPAKAKL